VLMIGEVGDVVITVGRAAIVATPSRARVIGIVGRVRLGRGTR
jgi:hypothetical protein